MNTWITIAVPLFFGVWGCLTLGILAGRFYARVGRPGTAVEWPGEGGPPGKGGPYDGATEIPF